MINHETVEQEAEEKNVLEDNVLAVDDVVQLSEDVITLSEEALVTDIEVQALSETPIKVNISDEDTEVKLNSGESYTFSSREDETFMEENITFESTEEAAEAIQVDEEVFDDVSLRRKMR